MKARLGLALTAAASLVQAVDVVYVTDLSIYTMLAPCAQDALSYNIMDLTETLCPTGVSGLQSCVCSQSSYSSSVSYGIATSVSRLCGGTASDDQASASSVFSAYCNQAAYAAFPTPSPAVTQYLTDIPELGFLALCASSQLAGLVRALTDTLCPTEATALATCACQKNENSLMMSESINTWVPIECESHTADLSSAQVFFAAYCQLNNGTSSFPSASFPSGDMSYYISDMPQFSNLASCARSAVASAVHSTAYYYCPTGGPQLLASCACIKPQMSSDVSRWLTDAVTRECADGDTDDMSSGLAVFAQYCSAARGEVVEAGITTSIAQTLPFGLVASTGAGSGSTRATATATSSQTASTTTGSGSSSGSASSTGSGSDNGSDSGSKKSSTHTGTIVGAVVGSVAGVALVVLAAFFAWRHARARNARQSADTFQQLDNLEPTIYGRGGRKAGGATADVGYSKPELGGTPVSSTTAVVSPMSPATAVGYPAQTPRTAELANNPVQPQEMPADIAFQSEPVPVPVVYSELEGSGQPR